MKRLLLIFWLGILSAHDEDPALSAVPATTIIHAAPASQELRTRQFLAQQYQHAGLQQKISLQRYNVTVQEVVEYVARCCGLSLVMPRNTLGRIRVVRAENQPAGQVLHALLAGHAKKWGVMVQGGVLQVAPQAVLMPRARQILEASLLPRECAIVPIVHLPWHENTKMQLEAMWHHCTREHIGVRRTECFFAHEQARRVVVQGTPAQVAQFKRLVAAADVPVPQVRLRARILLARSEVIEGIGMRITAGQRQLDAVPPRLTQNISLPFTIGRSAAVADQLAVVLTLAERQQKVQTLLAPHLISSSGQTAQLLEGQHVPIESETLEGGEGRTRTVRSAQYKEVGVQLTVTPQVLGKSGAIRLKVRIENSQVAATSTSTVHPTLTTSRIKNIVVMRSGQTVLLGGLVCRQRQQERQGVPWLSRVPFIGWFFGGHHHHNEVRRLYVLLHAEVA